MRKFIRSKTNASALAVFLVSFPMVYLLKGSFGEWVNLMIVLLGVIGVRNTVQGYVDSGKDKTNVEG